uniref:AlNc14C206G8812 protein n=1 Tax=Albugo laibachii Nc14 TaxID=890382 RepID=F0WR04_9STRA|nr:AlNc14C206G8812 [Albugo laibachii Nc14]|eukprot:CCA23764.1 AlNc14C206G8812 [Albugo laibachii Nc14]
MHARIAGFDREVDVLHRVKDERLDVHSIAFGRSMTVPYLSKSIPHRADDAPSRGPYPLQRDPCTTTPKDSTCRVDPLAQTPNVSDGAPRTGSSSISMQKPDAIPNDCEIDSCASLMDTNSMESFEKWKEEEEEEELWKDALQARVNQLEQKIDRIDLSSFKKTVDTPMSHPIAKFAVSERQSTVNFVLATSKTRHNQTFLVPKSVRLLSNTRSECAHNSSQEVKLLRKKSGSGCNGRKSRFCRRYRREETECCYLKRAISTSTLSPSSSILSSQTAEDIEIETAQSDAEMVRQFLVNDIKNLTIDRLLQECKRKQFLEAYYLQSEKDKGAEILSEELSTTK